MSLTVEPRTSARWFYWGLAGLLSLVWLATLAGRPLFNPDEGRYAEIPREMLRGGDWIIPHLNGLDYIEKPPLQYWATAATYRLLGVSEFSARLYTALTALATVALIGFLAARLWGIGAGLRAAAVLCGMFMFVILGQLMTLDMSLTFWMTASLAGFLLAQHTRSAERGWMLLAWVTAALGVLTKGLVAAAIPAGVLVIYSLWMRDYSPWRKLHLGLGAAAVLRSDGALALARSTAARRLSTVFHPRACRALLDAHRGSPGALVVLWLGFLGRNGALDRAGVTRTGDRLAHSARPIQSDLISVDMGRFYLRVFLNLRLKTHALHLAGDARLGGVDRRATLANPEAGFVDDELLDDRLRAGVWRGELHAAKTDS